MILLIAHFITGLSAGSIGLTMIWGLSVSKEWRLAFMLSMPIELKMLTSSITTTMWMFPIIFLVMATSQFIRGVFGERLSLITYAVCTAVASTAFYTIQAAIQLRKFLRHAAPN